MGIFSKDDFEDIAKEFDVNKNRSAEMKKQMESLRENAANLVVQTLDIYLEAAREYVGQASRFGIAGKKYSTDSRGFFAKKTPFLFDIGYGYFMSSDGELWKETRYCSYTVFSLQRRDILKQEVSQIINTPKIYNLHIYGYTAPSFSTEPSTWGEIRRLVHKLADLLLLTTFVCTYSIETSICINGDYGDYDVCSAHIGTQRDRSVIHSLIKDVFLTRIRERQTIT